jgi:Ca-activated chloride channel family protein
VDQIPQDGDKGGYIRAQVELDQIAAPAGQEVERHLVITLETPDALPPAHAAPAGTGREALHFVAVLDTSGSMRGDKIRAAKEAALQAARHLRDGDVFSLVTFSTDVHCTLRAKRIDGHMRRVIASAVDEIEAGGQTALCGALEQGIAVAAEARQSTNLVLLLSDGQANVGETDVEAVGRRALDARAQGVTVSTLGVGGDYNEALMAEIAIDGGGRFYHVSSADRIAAYLTGELGEMASLAAREVEVSVGLPVGAVLNTLSAAYPVRGATVSLGDLPLATTLEVVVSVRLPPHAPDARLRIESSLRYLSPAGRRLETELNRVTVRYEPQVRFVAAEGVVKPVVRRVLGHMRAAGVLATSRAAARSREAAQQQSRDQLSGLRAYASLLGQDREGQEMLAESEEVLADMVAPEPGVKAKQAAHAAMRTHRGSKDFSNT